MTLAETLIEVWRQVLVEGVARAELAGDCYRVSPTSRNKLRAVSFTVGRNSFDGIEQNPDTQSRWARLAREGQRVMQFRCAGRYVAVVAEGKLTRYPAWRALQLPD
jgi:hypothetical protein